jgi:hypothetical protein
MRKVFGVSVFLVIAMAGGAMAATPTGHVSTVEPSAHIVPHPGVAHKLCSMAGSWTDDYSYDMTLKGKKGKKGSIADTGCSGKYKAVISNLTKKGWDLTATYSGGTDCVSFDMVMTWNGSCTSASGTWTNAGGASGDDSWTLTTESPRGAAFK